MKTIVICDGSEVEQAEFQQCVDEVNALCFTPLKNIVAKAVTNEPDLGRATLFASFIAFSSLAHTFNIVGDLCGDEEMFLRAVSDMLDEYLHRNDKPDRAPEDEGRVLTQLTSKIRYRGFFPIEKIIREQISGEKDDEVYHKKAEISSRYILLNALDIVFGLCKEDVATYTAIVHEMVGNAACSIANKKSILSAVRRL